MNIRLKTLEKKIKRVSDEIITMERTRRHKLFPKLTVAQTSY
jgi:hypothetical protein